MTVSPESPPALASEQPRRAGRELLLEVVFRPVADLLVPVCRWARLTPPAVVLANAAAGLAAALALASGQLWPAAVLLQVKTLLDNADGQLARVTGRVTLVGRYLDTLADLLVNAAVFAALGYVTGQPLLAAAAFVALTVVLAADFNATELYRATNGIPTHAPHATGSRIEGVLATVYAALLGPLDRALRALAARRFPPGTSYDALTVTVLANLGLTTQLAVLGVCLVLDAPVVYLWLCLACLVSLVPLHLRAERRARG
jgi:phosphatidylglycerophosphate synthase